MYFSININNSCLQIENRSNISMYTPKVNFQNGNELTLVCGEYQNPQEHKPTLFIKETLHKTYSRHHSTLSYHYL